MRFLRACTTQEISHAQKVASRITSSSAATDALPHAYRTQKESIVHLGNPKQERDVKEVGGEHA